jgi:hypothetical protein
MRYFYTDNASHPIRFGSEVVMFTVTSRLAGSTQGVIQADGALATFLLSKPGIREITKEEYDQRIAKKKMIRFSPASTNSQPKQPDVGLKPKVGVAVEGSPPSSKADEEEEPIDLLNVGKIEEPPHEPALDKLAPKKRRRTRFSE